MPRKPTRLDEWNAEAVSLLRKHKTHDERIQMDGTKLFIFWGEHRDKLGHCPSSADVWQVFHSACMRYIGPKAYY
jgi:hypothetical protein